LDLKDYTGYGGICAALPLVYVGVVLLLRRMLGFSVE